MARCDDPFPNQAEERTQLRRRAHARETGHVNADELEEQRVQYRTKGGGACGGAMYEHVTVAVCFRLQSTPSVAMWPLIERAVR